MSEKKDFLENVRQSLNDLMEMLEANDMELNEDGDIIDKKTKRLVWDIVHGVEEDE